MKLIWSNEIKNCFFGVSMQYSVLKMREEATNAKGNDIEGG